MYGRQVYSCKTDINHGGIKITMVTELILKMILWGWNKGSHV